MSVVCLLLTLVLPPPAAAQQDTSDTAAINGRVTDETGAALPGVVLTIAGTANETTTDGEGGFQIDGLPPGKYVIRAALSGFAPAEQPVSLVAGETRTVDLTLGEGAYIFERVVVSEEGYLARRHHGALSAPRLLARLNRRLQ